MTDDPAERIERAAKAIALNLAMYRMFLDPVSVRQIASDAIEAYKGMEPMTPREWKTR